MAGRQRLPVDVQPVTGAGDARQASRAAGLRKVRCDLGVAVALVLVLLVRALVSVDGTAATGAGMLGDLGVVLTAGVSYVLTLRWGVWWWLAAAAAGYAALAPGLGPTGALPPSGAVVALLVAASLLVAAWRWRTSRASTVAAAALLLAGVVVRLVAGPVDVSPPADHLAGALWAVGALPLVVAVPALLLAVCGLGRAAGSGMRRMCGLTLAAVVLALILAGPAAVLLGPGAAALGVTAVLRGRRGASVERPQEDGHDAAALDAFRARYANPRLAPVVVVIAAYNEEPGLGDVLRELPSTACGMPLDVVVVDDGSSDRTSAVVERDLRAYLVAPGANRGQGAALRLGYRVAREQGARFIVTTDADGQYDPADIEGVLAPLVDGSADFVTGSRVLGGQETRDRVRRTGVHVFAWVATVLTGQRLTDTSFGLRAMRAEVTAAVTLNQPQYQSSELMLGAVSHGFRVREVPGRMRLRSHGTSKKGRNLVYGSRYARVVLGTWWREGCPAPAGLRAPALAGADPAPVGARTRRVLRHGPFLSLLVVGLWLRLLVQVAFFPAFIFSDGPTYLMLGMDPEPYPDRPVGYALLLHPLLMLRDDVLLVVLAQHLLGMVVATVLYLLLQRWGAGPWASALGAAPVLLDELQLNLEHSPLSDVVFEALVIGGLAVLCWCRTVGPARALVGGLVLGAAVTVRLVGEPLVLVGLAVCLLLGPRPWRRRVATMAACVVGFAVPVAAYAQWYHEVRGPYALSEFGGRALYSRTTSFVDCGRISVPEYQRVLCPAEPVGERRDPTWYAWHDQRTLPRLDPPPGVTDDQAMREFAYAAIRAQPLGYAWVVVRDFLLNFDVYRGDRFGYDTAYKWGFGHYVVVEPSDWTGPAYAAHGGRQLHRMSPLDYVLTAYGFAGIVPGPVLLACLVVAVCAVLGVGRARSSGLRAVTFTLTVTGAGLILLPAATAQFTWRYSLPAVVLLPAAAALAVTALRGGTPAGDSRAWAAGYPGTPATASTDWPNGGRTTDSTARVTGTRTPS